MSIGSNSTLMLRERARTMPDEPAIIAPADGERKPVRNWNTITFGELERRADAIANGFKQQGAKPGDRALFLMKPSIDSYATLFGMLRLGLVPVFIDPGMGLRRVLQCVEDIKPACVVALPIVHAIRTLRIAAQKRELKTLKEFLTTPSSELGGQYSAHSSYFMRYLLAGPGKSGKNTKDFLEKYLQACRDYAHDQEKRREAEGPGEAYKPPATEEEEEEEFRRRGQGMRDDGAWKERHREKLTWIWDRAFGDMKDSAWKSVEKSYRGFIVSR